MKLIDLLFVWWDVVSVTLISLWVITQIAIWVWRGEITYWRRESKLFLPGWERVTIHKNDSKLYFWANIVACLFIGCLVAFLVLAPRVFLK